MEWDTRMTVVPPAISSFIRFSHFCWKRKSPTASTSSAMRMSGLVMVAMAKPMRATMPEE